MIFPIKEVPKRSTVIQYLEEVSDLRSTMHACAVEKTPQFFKFKLPMDPLQFYSNYLKIKNKYGARGWLTDQGEAANYIGFSLTHNPAHQEGVDPLYSTLGSEKINQTESILRGAGNYVELRDSYYDTYGFNSVLPVISEAFHPLFNLFKMQPIRSRVSEIIGGNEITTNDNYGWHLDEQVFYNLRVNVPLTTSPEYMLQIEGQDELGHSLSLEEHLEVGYFYIWNTRIRHRVFAKSISDKSRTHVVLGFAPWFRFNTEGQSWQKNEFYGMHPLKLVNEMKIFNSEVELVKAIY